MRTLILVDIQNDFLPFGMHPQESLLDLINQINPKMPSFDRVLATQLWFPATHQRFAANHPWRHPGGTIEINNKIQILSEFFCVQDTFGAALIAPLDTTLIEKTFLRGTQADKDIHSIFYDAEEHSTGLLEYLLQEGIHQVTLAGVDLEETWEKSKEIKDIEIDFFTN